MEKIRLGRVLNLEYGKPLLDEKRVEEGLFPVYGANGIKGYSNEYYYDTKSIVIGRKGSAGEINLTTEKFWPLDVTYFVTFDTSKYDLFFLYCLLSILDMPNLAKGIKPGLNRNEVYDIKVNIPPLPAQTAIANFLDNKCSKIDALIENEEKIILELHEYKKLIIQKVTTKGLNHGGKKIPQRKMKQSGIEWIGEVPEDWKVLRLKYLGKAIIGLTYSPQELASEYEGTLVLRASNVQDEAITYDDCVYVTTRIPDIKRTKINDILICSRNGSVKLIGKNALIDEKSENHTFGAFMTVFRSQNYKYLHYFFNSENFKSQSGLFSTSTVFQLTTGILNDLLISIPQDDDEEKTITNYLDKKIGTVNKLISIKQKKISELKDYKKSLIYEYVTGKKEVKP
ncbi:MAG: restriction endonuclease subunit S [Treponema sp.]|nr:restriction endonuclease subunit S [Treponema sp.]